jgi:hypothetical protein
VPQLAGFLHRPLLQVRERLGGALALLGSGEFRPREATSGSITARRAPVVEDPAMTTRISRMGRRLFAVATGQGRHRGVHSGGEPLVPGRFRSVARSVRSGHGQCVGFRVRWPAGYGRLRSPAVEMRRGDGYVHGMATHLSSSACVVAVDPRVRAIVAALRRRLEFLYGGPERVVGRHQPGVRFGGALPEWGKSVPDECPA